MDPVNILSNLAPDLPRREPKVAVLGGGASGTVVAARLREKLEGGTIYIIEPNPRLGRGAAYGTDDVCHLLNVRAGNMSAKPEDPLHFVHWLQANRCRGESEDAVKVRFAPRRDYGEYLAELLTESASEVQVVHVTSSAISLARLSTGTRVGLEDGASVEVDAVVLALGNRSPSLPAALQCASSSPRLVVNPWAPEALSRIQPRDSVLMLGTGLTMVDAVLTLTTRGHKGAIYARSRRALLPHPHSPASPVTTEIEPTDHLFNQVINAVRAGGGNWRAVVDSLRPKTVALWQTLSWKDRSRFRARLQTYWDIHRHRMPESAWDTLCELQANGLLSIRRGRLLGLTTIGDALGARFCLGGEEEILKVDWLINCTGPNVELREAKVPVLDSGVAEGLLEYDPIGLGLMVDDTGRTAPDALVWALGPLCRGCRLETTAMPEIRVQAVQVAQEVLKSLRSAEL